MLQWGLLLPYTFKQRTMKTYYKVTEWQSDSGIYTRYFFHMADAMCALKQTTRVNRVKEGQKHTTIDAFVSDIPCRCESDIETAWMHGEVIDTTYFI